MTLAARPRTIPAPTARRLQHVARAALFTVAAIAAGWLGILAAPILDRIIVTAALPDEEMYGFLPDAKLPLGFKPAHALEIV